MAASSRAIAGSAEEEHDPDCGFTKILGNFLASISAVFTGMRGQISFVS